ncbi:hypothetical protein [Catenulispora rubra]|uniref:hypothetical protein n=1 Tax=Catenulispora rubra TaxID=280293 RepID=UPI0018924889|nr:hypothetical protein [Catenulispora rubra]
MRTFAGMGLVLAAEVAAAGGLTAAWRLRTRRKQPVTTAADTTAVALRLGRAGVAEQEDQDPDKGRDRGSKTPIPDHVSAVLEIEPLDAVLPSADPSAPIPSHILTNLRNDPLLGLADVRLLQHIQPTGAGLPERSQAGASYQNLNQDVARRLGIEPIPAARLTWLAFRLELPGSHRHALAARAAGPILARGGGITGAQRTLDKAARAASAKLALASYRTIALADDDYQPGFRSDLAETHEKVNEDTGQGAEKATATPGGVLIGVDPAHRPVTLGLFRRTTLSAAVVGSLHLAQILALRCAAVGARVIVETARQDEWDPVLLHSGLDAARLAVQPVGRPVGNPGWPAPSMANPLLVLRDCGARPPYATVPRGPWTAVVTLLPYFDPRTAGYLRDADLVGLQRMPREEAAMARHLLALPDKDTAALPDLPDPMVLWRSRKRTVRFCELASTTWEEAFLGEPVR